MKPTIKPNGQISAFCPDCEAIANFEQRGSWPDNTSIHEYKSIQYSRTLYSFNQCTGCGRGGMAKIHDSGNPQNSIIETFFPYALSKTILPEDVPTDIVAEFREAELSQSVGAKRAASALFRSVLEKTLKANGYIRQGRNLKDLQEKIDEAASDGIITETRRQRAHDEVRTLGNDVMHDQWREVDDEEVETSKHYTQRILEDFYDQRTEVEKILTTKGRLPLQIPQP